MDAKRRDFLKMAGLSALAGLAAPAAVHMLVKGPVAANAATPEHGAAAEGGHGEAPATGVRLGMVVDVKKFGENQELAQQCINACHSTHNVPDFGNAKDEIKWIWTEDFQHAFTDQSHYKRNTALHALPIMTLCNHCDNPPCVRACPTQATFKDKKTGAVLMDFHRCIGCRFCMAACPYGARSFNWRDPRGKDENGQPFIKHINPEYPTRTRGVVEKCNFCAERLAVGKQPACVEASGDTGALVFGDLNDPSSAISKVLAENFTIQRNAALGTKPSLFYII
jgi:molybdopterin-containing oxidoreductase family iron-sulfur binding subunit